MWCEELYKYELHTFYYQISMNVMKDLIFVSTAASTQLAPTPVLAMLATPLPAMDSVAQVSLRTT